MASSITKQITRTDTGTLLLGTCSAFAEDLAWQDARSVAGAVPPNYPGA